MHYCCNGFILQKGDPTPFTTVTCKAFVNSDYACHFLNAPPVLLYQKIESLDNGSLHCVAKRAPNTRGLLCCQMSNDSIQKNDTALSIRSQRLATTSVAPNCTCPPRTVLSIKALNDYITPQYSAVCYCLKAAAAPLLFACTTHHHVITLISPVI